MSKPSQKRRNTTALGLRYVFLAFFAVSMVLPLVWMITVSLKANDTIFVVPPDIFPKEFNWGNFSIAVEKMNFLRSFFNTLFITLMCVIGQVLSCTLVSYGIARIKFPGRKVWFYGIIASMMLPGMIGTIPMFMLYAKLNWINTFLPLIVPAFLGSPFYTFLLRQTFMGISRSFDEAAFIDGASHLNILFNILVPMIKPALMVIVIMATQASWNDYLHPLLYLHKENLWTLSIGIKAFIGQYATSWNLFMAADLLYMLPILILFMFLQRYFMSGLGSLNSTALK